MRIATLSDLHLDHSKNVEALKQLCEALSEGAPELLIVAGDISHKDARIREGLRTVRQLGAPVLFLPGNHELWQTEGEIDSWRRYHEALPALCAEEGAHYLPSAPFRRGRIAVAGSCGWYDYSLLLPEIRARFDDATLAKKRHGGGTWTDVRFTRFLDDKGAPMSDPAVARAMEEELEAQLSALDADPAIEHIVGAVHHLPYAELAFRTHSLPWEFFNAFIGSAGLGRVLDRCEKLHTVVYGHSHVHIERAIRGRRVYNRPLGYPRERRGISPEAYPSRYIGWIEVDA